MTFKVRVKKFVFFLLILTATMRTSAQSSTDSCGKLISYEIRFKKNSAILTGAVISKLDTIAMKMKNYPLCKIRIKGYGASDEEQQQISWDQVEAIVRYLRKKGVDKKYFVLSYGWDGNSNVVNLASTTEEGPDWVPAPHPCYSILLPRSKRCVDAHGNIPH